MRIWFTEKLLPAFCSLRVLDAAGKQIDKGNAHVDRKDATPLLVSLPPLKKVTTKLFGG